MQSMNEMNERTFNCNMQMRLSLISFANHLRLAVLGLAWWRIGRLRMVMATPGVLRSCWRWSAGSPVHTPLQCWWPDGQIMVVGDDDIWMLRWSELKIWWWNHTNDDYIDDDNEDDPWTRNKMANLLQCLCHWSLALLNRVNLHHCLQHHIQDYDDD